MYFSIKHIKHISIYFRPKKPFILLIICNSQFSIISKLIFNYWLLNLRLRLIANSQWKKFFVIQFFSLPVLLFLVSSITSILFSVIALTHMWMYAYWAEKIQVLKKSKNNNKKIEVKKSDLHAMKRTTKRAIKTFQWFPLLTFHSNNLKLFYYC